MNKLPFVEENIAIEEGKPTSGDEMVIEEENLSWENKSDDGKSQGEMVTAEKVSATSEGADVEMQISNEEEKEATEYDMDQDNFKADAQEENKIEDQTEVMGLEDGSKPVN